MAKEANSFRLQLRHNRFKFILLVKPHILVAKYLTYVQRLWFDSAVIWLNFQYYKTVPASPFSINQYRCNQTLFRPLVIVFSNKSFPVQREPFCINHDCFSRLFLSGLKRLSKNIVEKVHRLKFQVFAWGLQPCIYKQNLLLNVIYEKLQRNDRDLELLSLNCCICSFLMRQKLSTKSLFYQCYQCYQLIVCSCHLFSSLQYFWTIFLSY